MDTQPQQETFTLPDNLHIIQLESEKFKILDAVNMTVGDKGNLIRITGPNSAGKSSIIDSAHAALGGKSAMPDKPIKDGEESMTIRVTLGNKQDVALVVTRKATKKGDNTTHSLKVVTASGEEVSSPQQVLDAIVGDFMFDPLGFVYLKPKDQYDVLVGLLGLGGELDKIDSEIASRTQERLLVGREKDSLKGAVEQRRASLPNGDVPAAEVSIAALTQEYEVAQAIIQNYQSANRAADNLSAQCATGLAEIERLKNLLGLAEADLESSKAAYEAATVKVREIVTPDIAAIQAKLAGAEQANTNFRKLEEYKLEVNKLTEKTNLYDDLTRQIEKLRKQPESLLRKADIGVDGLAVRDGAVYYNDVPLSQCATSEQLVVGVKIGMLKNPTLRDIFIRDGSLIDSRNLALIGKMAGETDYNIWTEEVNETGEVGFAIYEGRVIHEPEVVAR